MKIISKGGEKVIDKKTVRLLKALKKDGYTLEQIIKLLEYVANQSNTYHGK